MPGHMMFAVGRLERLGYPAVSLEISIITFFISGL